ncbi:hypothetical protein, partial [Campylobacter sp.]|uniref:hypothetical protein n=2 Tax=Campylobacter sp. TaxID=205 RepID=UPI002AA746FC
QITNVPLEGATNKAVNDTANAYLTVGDDKQCIGFNIVRETGDVPTYIKFTPNASKKDGGVCDKVLKAKSVDAYLKSKVAGVKDAGAMPIGSSIKLKR